jgi:hypothetical protein
MNEQQQRALALETYDLLLQELKGTGIQVERHPKDPEFIAKSAGKDVMRIRVRVFPVERLPKGFWNAAACFYEIGVGPYEGRALCLGGVQFFQYAKQQRTGRCKYTQAVEKILKALVPKAPAGFALEPPTADGKFHFENKYWAKDYGSGVMFPCEDAARDLAWLIEHSLPKFSAL